MLSNKYKYRRINHQMLVKTMGMLLMIESVFMVVPLLVALCYGERDWLTFLCTSALTALCGLLMWWRPRPATTSMGKREGFLLTASVWVVFSLFGMLPFIFSATPYTVDAAFTEAMSGLTTTGATIIDDVEALSHGLKMWRSLMQWIGGMGIILFTLAVIPMLNHSGGMQMFNAEVTGITHNKLLPRISQTAKALWMIYGTLTLLCIILLLLGPMDTFESVTHGLSTIATGGFSIYNDGIEHYHSGYVKVVTTVFMFLASINFGIIFALMHRRYRSVLADEPFRVFVGSILALSVVILVSEYVNGAVSDWGRSVVDTLFMVVSAFSSTSYTSAGIEGWGSIALGLLIVMIAIGGCAGSTAGGAKIDRVIVSIKYIKNEIRHVVQPNAVNIVKVSRHNIPSDLVGKVIAFMGLYLMVIVTGALGLALMGVPVYDSVFTSITCISNSGTCIDIGMHGGSLAQVPACGKLLMAMAMLTGRLELFTVLVLFTSAFWRK